MTEFPLNSISVAGQSDVMSPSDKFLTTDKDNVFSSFRWTTVDQMMYVNKFTLKYQREWANGMKLEAQLKRERDEGVDALFYQKLGESSKPSADKALHERYLHTTDITLGLTYSPGAKYINTKQRRTMVNHEVPVFSLSHTIGLKMLGGKYTYNLTEATIYKRLWMPSAWGRMDISLKGGAQWNRVPYPLLIMPAANLSYIAHDETFFMLNNMEFLNDRYASLMVDWSLNGKVFNRIPLLRKLKWREVIGCNVLWGQLTDKNNPWENPGDSRLYYFPGHFNASGDYEYSSHVMESDKPYVEVYAGIYNIFQVLQVQVVRRLNYLYLPDAKKWGWRMKLRLTF